MATRNGTGGEAGQAELIGYQAAISLWAHERGVCWNRFNVMLLVNAIVMAVLAATFANDSSAQVPALILCVIGLALSATWLALTRRSFEVQNYYLKSAQEIEEGSLGGAVRTLARGEAFGQGEKVTLTLDGDDETMQLGGLAGVVTAEMGAQVLIGIFGGLYVLLAILTVVQMGRQMF